MGVALGSIIAMLPSPGSFGCFQETFYGFLREKLTLDELRCPSSR